MDIDHFKAVNDTLRTSGGDMALRAVTSVLREQLRSYDVAGRFGGEEFVILLPHTRETDTLAIAERLRAHIAAMAIPIEDGAPAKSLHQAYRVDRRSRAGRGTTPG